MLSCVGSGWGNTCTTDGTGHGYCTCTTSSECGDLAPLCVAAGLYLSSSNKMCACNTTYDGAHDVCFDYQVCVNAGASGSCKTRNGFPCISNASCTSGACTNGGCL